MLGFWVFYILNKWQTYIPVDMNNQENENVELIAPNQYVSKSKKYFEIFNCS